MYRIIFLFYKYVNYNYNSFMDMKKLLSTFLLIFATVAVWCEEPHLPELEKIGTFSCGNQPTGLDINRDGTLLCFSNFQDANIEVYSIKQ